MSLKSYGTLLHAYFHNLSTSMKIMAERGLTMEEKFMTLANVSIIEATMSRLKDLIALEVVEDMHKDDDIKVPKKGMMN